METTFQILANVRYSWHRFNGQILEFSAPRRVMLTSSRMSKLRVPLLFIAGAVVLVAAGPWMMLPIADLQRPDPTRANAIGQVGGCRRLWFKQS